MPSAVPVSRGCCEHNEAGTEQEENEGTSGPLSRTVITGSPMNTLEGPKSHDGLRLHKSCLLTLPPSDDSRPGPELRPRVERCGLRGRDRWEEGVRGREERGRRPLGRRRRTASPSAVAAGARGSGSRGRAGGAEGRGVKCVLVGDGAVGKTSLVVSYTTNGYPTEYIPTAFDNFSAVVSVDGRPVKLQLCDTAGQDEFDKLRPLCYTNADIFLLCFSVVGPSSFQNVSEKWVPEIRCHCPKAPIILVGTQSDLREDVKVLIELDKCKEKPVPEEAARLCAEEIKATSYIECSALTQKNLKEVFDAAIVAGIQYSDSQQQPKKSKSRTPDKMKTLSKSWWKKYCCFV
nr:rho-related GTP-binding protein RhoU-like [Odocoileus virginianus texanus]